MAKSDSNEGYFLHLVACGLLGTAPNGVPASVSLRRVFELAKFHGVCALTFSALVRSETVPHDTLYAAWRES